MIKSVENGLEADSLNPKCIDLSCGRRRQILPLHKGCIFKRTEPPGQYVRCDLRNSRSQVREALCTYVETE
jgi:hypothetical protein